VAALEALTPAESMAEIADRIEQRARHLGSATRHTRRAMADLVVANLISWIAGKGSLTPTPETPWRG
jgi:lactate dehydrogenase-like 2-hydroxyacid dehydrogenase